MCFLANMYSVCVYERLKWPYINSSKMKYSKQNVHVYTTYAKPNKRNHLKTNQKVKGLSTAISCRT